MISMHGISSTGAAFSYFSERDDYYRADASSAEWYGRGADLAGLSGDVDSRDFRAVLEGRIDDTQVGRADAHAPGWDMTFSAPTLSRAREHADVFTDNKQRLADTLERNPGIKETAIRGGSRRRRGAFPRLRRLPLCLCSRLRASRGGA